MDGLEVARRLRGDPDLRGIPALALTAHVGRSDEESAREAGCVGYITKPIDPDAFLSQIAACLASGGAWPISSSGRG
jgi:CheY-like chemotaxis protein